MQPDELKALRKGAGLTLASMADLMGMSLDSIGRMERGVKGYPIERRTGLAAQHIYADIVGPCFEHADREGDVPLAEATILWDSLEEGVSPPVKVLGSQDADDRRYSASRGACDGDWTIGSDVFRLLRLFALVQHMTLVEKIDPRAVHDALIVIPEYRRLLPPDPSLGLGRDDQP